MYVQTQACCKGFYGPDCSPCPGGFQAPCSGHGQVRSTVRAPCRTWVFVAEGSWCVLFSVWKGSEEMDPVFVGKTSEVLAVSTVPCPTNMVRTATQVGVNRTMELNDDVRWPVWPFTCMSSACPCIHGRCDNRPDSDGRCKPDSCLQGFTGQFCERQTSPCGTLAQFCHAHADCDFSDGSARWVYSQEALPPSSYISFTGTNLYQTNIFLTKYFHVEALT